MFDRGNNGRRRVRLERRRGRTDETEQILSSTDVVLLDVLLIHRSGMNPSFLLGDDFLSKPRQTQSRPQQEGRRADSRRDAPSPVAERPSWRSWFFFLGRWAENKVMKHQLWSESHLRDVEGLELRRTKILKMGNFAWRTAITPAVSTWASTISRVASASSEDPAPGSRHPSSVPNPEERRRDASKIKVVSCSSPKQRQQSKATRLLHQ